MYIHCTSVPRIVCIYHYCGCHCILACTAFDIGIKLLSYRNLPLCTYRDIPPTYPLRMTVKTAD